MDPNPTDAYGNHKVSQHKIPDAGETLKALADGSGPLLTTTEVARLTGMSATFIRKEIGDGYLQAVRIGRGRKRVFRITVRETRRYMKELGLL